MPTRSGNSWSLMVLRCFALWPLSQFSIGTDWFCTDLLCLGCAHGLERATLASMQVLDKIRGILNADPTCVDAAWYLCLRTANSILRNWSLRLTRYEMHFHSEAR